MARSEPHSTVAEARARLEAYADWLADPRDDGNPYDVPIDEPQWKEADIRTILAALEPPTPDEGVK